MATKKKAPSSALQEILAKLETSCLTARDAELLRIVPEDPAVLAGKGLPAKRAMRIPYFALDGKPSKFMRWRYMEDTRDGFDMHTDKKPLRYAQEGDSVTEAYFPPSKDWAAIAKDPEHSIVFTEGELKAACVCKVFGACIGLGGVYSFKSKRHKLPLLPFFYQFDWVKRDVIIAYDSDASINPMVVAARNELCAELVSLGALPRVAHVPPTENGLKQGIDDLAYAAILNGDDPRDVLLSLIESAEEYAPSAALHALSEEVAYIVDPGLVVVLESGLKMSAAAFTTHAYANRHYYVMVLDAKGNDRQTKKPAAPAWIGWEHRFELQRLTFSPGLERITEAKEYNTWPGWGCKPKRGDIGPWRKLLDKLFAGFPAERSWFERWLALPLQQPGAKQYAAAVLWGRTTGTGKSLVGVSMKRIYGDNYALIGDQQLVDPRNTWAIDKQFVMGDDVTGKDQRLHADRLKSMITQETMLIDPKYIPAYTVPDRINYYFNSNHPDAFFLEDDDRRFFVHEVIAEKMTREERKEYLAWLRGDGPSALFYHLLRLDLQGLEVGDHAMETDAKRAMVEDGLSDLGRWVRQLKQAPDSVLRVGNAPLPGDLWSAAELLRLYDPNEKGRVTAGGLNKEMKRAGFLLACGGKPIRCAGGAPVLFSVRGNWFDRKEADAAEHHDKTRGAIGAKALVAKPDKPGAKKKY